MHLKELWIDLEPSIESHQQYENFAKGFILGIRYCSTCFVALLDKKLNHSNNHISFLSHFIHLDWQAAMRAHGYLPQVKHGSYVRAATDPPPSNSSVCTCLACAHLNT